MNDGKDGPLARPALARKPGALKPRLLMVDGEPMTTSLAVAEHFGKLHKNVLRDIANLECSEEFHRLNFELVKETMTYVDSSGNQACMQTDRTGHYRMTRDGFVFLAMGFTGAKAAAWKEAYITAFNRMEHELARRIAAEHETTQVLLSDKEKALNALTDKLAYDRRLVSDFAQQYKRLEQEHGRRLQLLIDLDCQARYQAMVLERADKRITGLEEFGALMVVTRLRTVDAMVLGYLLRRCALVSRSGTPGWVEATVPHIASALAWNSTHQVATALRRLVKQELIQCRHLGPTRRAYFAHPSKAIERLNEIREESGTAESLLAVPDSISPLAGLLRAIMPVTKGKGEWSCLVAPEDALRIIKRRGDDGSVPRPNDRRPIDAKPSEQDRKCGSAAGPPIVDPSKLF